MIIKLLSILAALSAVKSDFNETFSRVKREGFSDCGVRSQALSLVYRGQAVTRGKWPWLVALTHASSPFGFFCGAVLVGPKRVVTGEKSFIDDF